MTAIAELNRMDGAYPPERQLFHGSLDLVVRYVEKEEG